MASSLGEFWNVDNNTCKHLGVIAETVKVTPDSESLPHRGAFHRATCLSMWGACVVCAVRGARDRNRYRCHCGVIRGEEGERPQPRAGVWVFLT